MLLDGHATASDLGNDPRDEARRYHGELKQHLVDTAFRRAAFYDRIAHRPRSAVIAYSDFIRQFPLTTEAEKAKERIAILEEQTNEQSNHE